MIRSMTAWARHEIKREWGSAIWELRSVNQRYLESDIRLPESFRSLEPTVRNQLRARITRGRVECNLRVELSTEAQHVLILNTSLAKELIKAANWIKRESLGTEINPLDILRWPGVMVAQKQDLDVISGELILSLERALDNFISARQTEGAVLKALIEQRLIIISGELAKIRAYLPEILLWQREKLLHRLQEAQIQCDTARVEQELIFTAQRLDIAEELDRLEVHVQEVHNTLSREEAIGRRLDFIVQELNRESNTIASKSINADITNSAIELKVLLEQIREQIQNIE